MRAWLAPIEPRRASAVKAARCSTWNTLFADAEPPEQRSSMSSVAARPIKRVESARAPAAGARRRAGIASSRSASASAFAASRSKPRWRRLSAASPGLGMAARAPFDQRALQLVHALARSPPRRDAPAPACVSDRPGRSCGSISHAPAGPSPSGPSHSTRSARAISSCARAMPIASTSSPASSRRPAVSTNMNGTPSIATGRISTSRVVPASGAVIAASLSTKALNKR